MRTHAIATALVASFLALTACTSAEPAESGKPTPEAKPSASKTYTYKDCVALLEYDYQEGKPQDASKDPECAHLTRDQYVKAVG